MTSYLISNHVHYCQTGGQLVFLDLRHDKYFSIGKDELAALEEFLTGQAGTQTGPDQSLRLRLADALIEVGILTSDQRRGRKYAPAAIVPVERTLLEDELAYVTLGTRHVLAFLYACTRAALALLLVSLRLRSLEQLVRVRQHRRAVANKQARRAGPTDRELVARFHALRPFVYTAKERCLFDSIALLDFLAIFHFYPDWVIAVRTGPFGAHSWVQGHGCVFNDSIEHVRRFTPILTV